VIRGKEKPDYEGKQQHVSAGKKKYSRSIGLYDASDKFRGVEPSENSTPLQVHGDYDAGARARSAVSAFRRNVMAAADVLPEA
jgi:hypothetical protein